MEYFQPIPSTRAGKKYMVRVWDPYIERDKIIHFGSTEYQDYSQHHDSIRRDSYLSRSSKITNKQKQYTKDDPLYANYWSRRFLWRSDEPYYVYTPPDLEEQQLLDNDYEIIYPSADGIHIPPDIYE